MWAAALRQQLDVFRCYPYTVFGYAAFRALWRIAKCETDPLLPQFVFSYLFALRSLQYSRQFRIGGYSAKKLLTVCHYSYLPSGGSIIRLPSAYYIHIFSTQF